MKSVKSKLRVSVGYEPNRFAKEGLISAYEVLCPDKKVAIVDNSKSESVPVPHGQKSSGETKW